MLDYFKVLGIEIDASFDHVKKAFRTLAKQWHPDKNRSPGAEDKFKEIKAAYEYLQSDDRRGIHAADIRRSAAGDKDKLRDAQKSSAGYFNTSRSYAEPQSTSDGDECKTGVPKAESRPHDAKRRENGSGKARSPRAADREEVRSFWQHRRTKMDSGAFHRAPSAKPTFEYVFDFMSFDPFMEDFVNARVFDGRSSSHTPRNNAAPRKPKKQADPFGNPLPDNVDAGMYDWNLPRFANNWADLGDPEFFCHYCGRLMAISLLRRHEPKCARLGGARKTWFLDPSRFNEDESVIQKTRQKMTQQTGKKMAEECNRCGQSLGEGSSADHSAECAKHEERSRTSRSARRHRTPRSASAHPRPQWNKNFFDDLRPGSDATQPNHGDTKESQSKERPSAPGRESPFASKGCMVCTAKYGLHAGIFCSCSVSHCL